MLVKRIAACAHLSSTVYELLVVCNFPSLHLMPQLGVFRLEFREKSFDLRKLKSWRYQAVKTV